MSRRAFLMMTLGVCLCPAAARADDASPLGRVGQARLVGRGRLNVALMPVFDVELYAPAGRFREDDAFALRVGVLRSLKGAQLARHAVREMHGIGMTDASLLAQWSRQLEAILPDTRPQDSLYIVRDTDGATRFFRDSAFLGGIADPRFTATFFAICLGPRTSQPELRRRLLALS